MTFRETSPTPFGTCVFQMLGCLLATKSSSITPRSWIMTNHDHLWLKSRSCFELSSSIVFSGIVFVGLICFLPLPFPLGMSSGSQTWVQRVPCLIWLGLPCMDVAMYGCCHVPTPNHPTIQLSLATNLKNITNISSLFKKCHFQKYHSLKTNGY